MSGGSPVRVRVKICGITSPGDAVAAEQAGADAIGMVFAPSKRRVDLQAAAEIVAALGPFVTTVGVFRDAPLDVVLEAVQALRLDVAQLHGAEGPEFAAEVGRRAKVMKALTYTEAGSPAVVSTYPAAAFLIDGPKPGSGEPYDWRAIAAWRGHPRLVLAGGLDAANVAAAVNSLRPHAVDVSTGVESSAGVKDHAAIRRFVAEVRRAEHSLSTGP